MKKIKRRISKATFMVTMGLTQLVFAASGEDPFRKATDKTEEAIGYLSGQLAIAIATLVIVVAGLALMFGKLRMEWAIKIMSGAIIIGAAGGIATWLMN